MHVAVAEVLLLRLLRPMPCIAIHLVWAGAASVCMICVCPAQ
jgi:hypothetical protein